jgi:hypothetical protein
MSDQSAIKYKGDGSQYVPGVPARDLTTDEFKALSQEQQKAVLESGLYEMPVNQKPKEVAKKEA